MLTTQWGETWKQSLSSKGPIPGEKGDTGVRVEEEGGREGRKKSKGKEWKAKKECVLSSNCHGHGSGTG